MTSSGSRFASSSRLEGPISEDEQRQFGTLAHLGGLLAIYPPLNLLPALVIYLVYRGRGALVRDQSSEALNFQITVFIAQLVVWFIDSLVSFNTYLSLLLWVFSAVFSILAALTCGRGGRYHYPLSIRFLH
jgi:uncharacterized protein